MQHHRNHDVYFAVWLCTFGLIGFAVSCSRTETIPSTHTIPISKVILTDGLTYEIGQKSPHTGIIFDSYSNGVKKLQAQYVSGKANGIQQTWYENGSRRTSATYLDGKENGTAMEWHPNGKEKTLVRYTNGIATGEHQTWHTNGQRSLRANYDGGKLHGPMESWFPDGKLSSQSTFVNGKTEGIHLTWHENGRTNSKTPYENGKRNGIVKVWNPDESLASESVFRDDKLISEKKWDAAGNEIKDQPASIGRTNIWTTTTLKQIYIGKPQATIFSAFGKPDGASKDGWNYNGIRFNQGANTPTIHQVRFHFASGKVQNIQIE